MCLTSPLSRQLSGPHPGARQGPGGAATTDAGRPPAPPAAGVLTRVNEQAVKDRFAEAVDRGLYELRGEWARWGELPALVEPYVIDFYRDWLPEEITSGHAYNTATGPAGFDGGTARGGMK